MKESKAMMRKEVSFMKKKGAPKSMIKHEEAEMEGKKMRKFAEGGQTLRERIAANRARMAEFSTKMKQRRQEIADRKALKAAPPTPPVGKIPMPDAGGGGGSNALNALRNRAAAPPAGGAAAPAGGMGGAGGNMAPMRKGGSVYRKGADGVAHKGKTKGKMVKMREGGSVFRKSADGIASKGKTKGKMVRMMMGGKC